MGGFLLVRVRSDFLGLFSSLCGCRATSRDSKKLLLQVQKNGPAYNTTTCRFTLRSSFQPVHQYSQTGSLKVWKSKKNILSITTSLNDLIITKPYILRKHSSWGEREIIYWQLTMDQGQTKAEGSLLLTWTNYSDEKGENETTIPPQKKQSPASAAHLRWLFVDGVRKLSSWPECCGFLVCGEENIPAIFIQSRRYAPAWQCNSVWHLTRLTIFAQETHYPKAFHHVNLNQILSQ